MNQRLGEKCFVIGNELYRRSPSLLVTGIEDKVTSVAMIGLDQANTITGLVQKAKSVTGTAPLLAHMSGSGFSVKKRVLPPY